MVMQPTMAERISIDATGACITRWDACQWLLMGMQSTTATYTETSTTDTLTMTAAEAIFTAVYRVLLDITRYHRDALLDVLPAYATQLRSLVHCLRVPQAAATADQLAQLRSQLPFPLVSRHIPLPAACANHVARLWTALVDHGAVQATATATSTATSTEGTPATIVPSLRDDQVTASSQMLRALGKYAPYLLSEWLHADTAANSRFTATTRVALLPGVYALLDLCTEHERDHLFSMLDHVEAARLKEVYRTYVAHHKYTGKA
jgi:hypothetical protein